MSWRAIITLCLGLLPFQAHAQSGTLTPEAASEEDRGFLTNLLERSLSGYGRTVQIDGFAGAFSSRATFTRLTIADDDGVWLSIENGAISWTRAALLSGRLEIDELSAATIHLDRAPDAGGQKVEARGFSLPTLPVSVNIGVLRADQLFLGADVLGEPTTVTIAGAAKLENGEGNTDFSIRRVDGTDGQLSLKASFSNSTRMAVVDFLVEEGANGIAAGLLGLPGRPSVQLAVSGSGPIDTFSADLALATDGKPRLTGNIALSNKAATQDADAEQRFSVAVQGDISPMLQPEYRDFFGNAVSLEADGVRRPGGRTDLTRLVFDSPGMSISGRLGLSPEYIPLAAALTMRFGLAGDEKILLPFPGTPTYAKTGVLRLRYDAELSDEWTIAGDLFGFSRETIEFSELTLDGGGRILLPGPQTGKTARILGSVGFAANGVALGDPALDAALGPSITGQTVFVWQDGKPLLLRNLSARAGNMTLDGDLAISSRKLDVTASGTMDASVPDVARFSMLAGRPLGGAADLHMHGSIHLLTRAFNVEATANGQGLTVGNTTLDQLLVRNSQIAISAQRDATGLTIHSLTIEVPALRAKLAGTINSDMQDLNADIEVSDLAFLGQGFGGAISASATLTGRTDNRRFDLSGRGNDLRLGFAQADPLFAGTSSLTLSAVESDGLFEISEIDFSNARIKAKAAATQTPGTLEINARVSDVARVMTGISGPVNLAGRLSKGAGNFEVSLDGTGPGPTMAKLAGTISRDFSTADLTLTGTGQSAILNGLVAPRGFQGPVSFDLRLNGAPRLASVSGKVTGNGLRLASPNEGISLRDMALVADLSNGRAAVDVKSSVFGGGTLHANGPIDLAAPYQSALIVELDHARLRNPKLFDTTISGNVSVTGPILDGAVIGGELLLHKTEISVAEPNFGAPEVPDVQHRNESRSVLATLNRANINGELGNRRVSGPVFGLDLSITAPSEIFVRGRGLNAELGGTVHLGGTTNAIQPSGEFELRRGRFSLLGRRFVLSEGTVQLTGTIVPYINFSASTDTFGITSTIVVSGPADNPQLNFSSSSGVPEEEVISEMLFGNGINNISSFQLAQLITSISTLSGRSEDLISRMRQKFQLDDLDITADEDGNGGIRAGKYVTDKVYSEGSVSGDGSAQIQLQLDVNTNLSVSGTLGTDGTSGAAILFSKDY